MITTILIIAQGFIIFLMFKKYLNLSARHTALVNALFEKSAVISHPACAEQMRYDCSVNNILEDARGVALEKK